MKDLIAAGESHIAFLEAALGDYPCGMAGASGSGLGGRRL